MSVVLGKGADPEESGEDAGTFIPVDVARSREHDEVKIIDLFANATTRCAQGMHRGYAQRCELREEFRSFRVDRMSAMTEGDRFREEPGRRLQDFYAEQQRRERYVAERRGVACTKGFQTGDQLGVGAVGLGDQGQIPGGDLLADLGGEFARFRPGAADGA